MKSPRSLRKPARFLTLNIHGLGTGWFERRKGALIDSLRTLRPDVLALQETTIRHAVPNYYQVQEVGDAIGLHYCAFTPYGNPIEVMSIDEGGIAIASRWPIRSVRNRNLPPGHPHPADARVALFATIEAPSGALHVVTTHLSWKPDEAHIRLVQIGLILNDLSRDELTREDARVVLLGDLNALETEPCIALARDHLKDAYRARSGPGDPGSTWTTRNPLAAEWDPLPDRRLDYVFCTRSARVREARVVFNGVEEPFVSDHFGVLSEIDFPPLRRPAPSPRPVRRPARARFSHSARPGSRPHTRGYRRSR